MHSAEKVLESRALQSLLDRIHDERDEVKRWERHLADAKRRRDPLLRLDPLALASRRAFSNGTRASRT